MATLVFNFHRQHATLSNSHYDFNDADSVAALRAWIPRFALLGGLKILKVIVGMDEWLQWDVHIINEFIPLAKRFDLDVSSQVFKEQKWFALLPQVTGTLSAPMFNNLSTTDKLYVILDAANQAKNLILYDRIDRVCDENVCVVDPQITFNFAAIYIKTSRVTRANLELTGRFTNFWTRFPKVTSLIVDIPFNLNP